MMQNVMNTILAEFFDMPESKVQIEEQTPVKSRKVPGPGDKAPTKPKTTARTKKSPQVRKITAKEKEPKKPVVRKK